MKENTKVVSNMTIKRETQLKYVFENFAAKKETRLGVSCIDMGW